VPQNQTTIPIFATASFVALEGTQWRLDEYINRKGNPGEPLPGTSISLTFQNGQIVGQMGCNSYIGQYQIQSDQLIISPPIVTEKFCASPEGLMDQESNFIKMLQSASSFKIIDQRLQILNSQGQTILTFSSL
jgi:heat shock protein HslJ